MPSSTGCKPFKLQIGAARDEPTTVHKTKLVSALEQSEGIGRSPATAT